MSTKNIPDIDVSFFINRILAPVNSIPWWQDLEGEDRQGKQGRFLSEEFANELLQEKNYQFKTANNKLLFFSNRKTCAIDGKFKELGIELKCKDLSFKSLIDGAIHRGLLWVYGNPQNFDNSLAKSISIYVLKKGSKPIKKDLANLYFPVLKEISGFGVYLFFITQEGESWGNFEDANFNKIPTWLTHNYSNPKMPPANQSCIDSISNNAELLPEKYLYGRSKRHIFNETRTKDIGTGKVAIMEWWNHMQMLEIGLLLRAKGYNAVKITHDQSIEGQKHPMDYGIEKRVKMKMLNNHGVLLDWKHPL
jgi:hypothetical protein